MEVAGIERSRSLGRGTSNIGAVVLSAKFDYDAKASFEYTAL